MACTHDTAIVLNTFPNGLEQMLCTCLCKRVYWLLNEQGKRREITNREALALIGKLPDASATVVIPLSQTKGIVL